MTKRYFTSALRASLVGFVDLLNGNDFDIGSNVVFAAEVEHLLRLGNAANGRSGETATAKQQIECGDGQRFLRVR